jgi:hypothetical protein
MGHVCSATPWRVVKSGESAHIDAAIAARDGRRDEREAPRAGAAAWLDLRASEGAWILVVVDPTVAGALIGFGGGALIASARSTSA